MLVLVFKLRLEVGKEGGKWERADSFSAAEENRKILNILYETVIPVNVVPPDSICCC
jgi:hypothetical protein